MVKLDEMVDQEAADQDLDKIGQEEQPPKALAVPVQVTEILAELADGLEGRTVLVVEAAGQAVGAAMDLAVIHQDRVAQVLLLV
jgi:hypothetical protein